MTGKTNSDRRLPWLFCGVLVLDILAILDGYRSWFQTTGSLQSPLIPTSTTLQIAKDSGELIMKASVGAGIVTLVGCLVFVMSSRRVGLNLMMAALLVYVGIRWLG